MQSLHLYGIPSDKRIEGSLGTARNKTEVCPPKSYCRECVKIQRIYYSSLYTVPCVLNPVSYLKPSGTVASLATSGNKKTYGYPRFSSTFHNDTTFSKGQRGDQTVPATNCVLCNPYFQIGRLPVNAYM